jgi:hypothetical protein
MQGPASVREQGIDTRKDKMLSSQSIHCSCGQFHLEVHGAPFINAECHCDSCRAAAARLQALPGAGPVCHDNGGTQYRLYRKDRVTFPAGTGLLREFRLTPSSTTRRIVTACCNTPVFLEFKGGHWLSIYELFWPAEQRSRPDIRTMTGDTDASKLEPSNVPAGALTTAGFYAKLLVAWVAMGFKVPQVHIEGSVDA